MDSDKIIISIACVLLLFGFTFRKNIWQEWTIWQCGAEVEALMEELTFSHFHPFSLSERISLIEQHIDKMKALEKRIAQSVIVKHFTDFGPYLQEREQEIKEGKESLMRLGNTISFTTERLNSIVAHPDFTREQLVAFASLADLSFPEPDYTVTYMLHMETSSFTLTGRLPMIMVNLSPDLPKIEYERYQEFLNQASKGIFGDSLVSLCLFDLATETEEILFSQEIDFPFDTNAPPI